MVGLFSRRDTIFVCDTKGQNQREGSYGDSDFGANRRVISFKVVSKHYNLNT